MDQATRAKDAIMTHLGTLNIDGVTTVAVGEDTVVVRVAGGSPEVADSVYLIKLTISRA